MPGSPLLFHPLLSCCTARRRCSDHVSAGGGDDATWCPDAWQLPSQPFFLRCRGSRWATACFITPTQFLPPEAGGNILPAPWSRHQRSCRPSGQGPLRSRAAGSHRPVARIALVGLFRVFDGESVMPCHQRIAVRRSSTPQVLGCSGVLAAVRAFAHRVLWRRSWRLRQSPPGAHRASGAVVQHHVFTPLRSSGSRSSLHARPCPRLSDAHVHHRP